MSELTDRVDRMRANRQADREIKRASRALEVEQKNRQIEQRRSSNRDAFPVTAGLVDLLNNAGLGPVRVLMAEEGGRVVRAKGYE